MIYVPLNTKDMLRRDLSLKSHPKDEVIFPGDRQFCFLAHLSRRLIGELIVYKGIRPSSVRPSTFSNDISSEAEKPILFIFHI